MNKLWVGITAGLILGVIDILMILPFSVPNKELAVIGAFSNRFAIGLFTVTLVLGIPKYVQGLMVGLILSILPAVTRPEYGIMIVVLGALAGLLTGIISERFVSRS